MSTTRITSRRGWGAAAPTLLSIAAIAALVAIAASQGGTTVQGVPVIILCALLAFAVQWFAFLPAYRHQTERFYDLTGSITYLSIISLALLLTDSYDLRSLLLSLLVIVWAVRLGTFLYRRVHREGGDGRFAKIKTRAPSFFVAWTLQGLWVFLTSCAALAAITVAAKPPLGPLDYVGLGVWILGFAIEVVADRQKSRFRQDPSNRGRFIDRGLWSWSRHPNYFGEIVLWIGVAIIASTTLAGWRWVTLISPVFVIFLLTRVSGVSMLEQRADEKWGDDDDYERYKKRTSVLVPFPPRMA